MTLTLRVLAPDQSVFDDNADEVILPSTTGQVGILTGHVSMLTALDSGVLRLRQGSTWQSIALMGGFAEVEANQVTVLVNAAELASYDQIKQSLLASGLFQDNIVTHITAGLGSGFFAVCVGSPVDVVKSRVMGDSSGKYSGVLDCFVKTARNDGLLAFYNGFMPNFAMAFLDFFSDRFNFPLCSSSEWS